MYLNRKMLVIAVVLDYIKNDSKLNIVISKNKKSMKKF